MEDMMELQTNGDMDALMMPVEQRSIEIITAEIWLYKQQAGAAILEIGKRLNEAKEQLSHGEWLPWLEEKVEFSEVTAQRFMRIAKEYKNPSLVTDLGTSKALILLALPENERREFLEEKHEIDGQEKTVFEMSKRELEQAIKERDEARREAEEAREREEGTTLKLADVEDALHAAEEETEKLQEKLEEERAEAVKAAQSAEEEISKLKEQMQMLQEAPKEVAIEKIVDEDAVKAAAEEAKKKAEAALRKEIEKAQSDREKAEKAKAKAEQEIAALKVAQEEQAAVALQEKKAMEERMNELQKKLAVAASSEIVVFKLYFEQGQESVNKMNECISKMRSSGDAEGAGKLGGALKAFLTAALGALEE